MPVFHHLYPELSNEPEDFRLTVETARDEPDMRSIGRKLVERGIDCRPAAEPDFRPCVVVEAVVHVHDAHGDTRRYSCCPCEGRIECSVFIAITHSLVQYFEGTRDADDGFLKNYIIHPLVQFFRGGPRILLTAEYCCSLLSYSFVIALDQRIRFEVVLQVIFGVGQIVCKSRRLRSDFDGVPRQFLTTFVEFKAGKQRVVQARLEIHDGRSIVDGIRGNPGESNDIHCRALLIKFLCFFLGLLQEDVPKGAFLLDRFSVLGDPGERLHSLERLLEFVNGFFFRRPL